MTDRRIEIDRISGALGTSVACCVFGSAELALLQIIQ